MRLQLALDAPEHLALVPRLAHHFDLVEVGTPLLKRFGVGVISTVIELGGGAPVLADTKTVDGGGLEAEAVFSAGATIMTVLSNAAPATRAAALAVAGRFEVDVVFDTILEADPAEVRLPDPPSATGRWVALHTASDGRGAQVDHRAERVERLRRRGFRVVLAGGISQKSFGAVLASRPDVMVIGSSVTSAADPEGAAEWFRQQTDRAR